jgi:hypothetical protein
MARQRNFAPQPARWGDGEVGSLTTVQLHYGGFLDGEPHGEHPIHLVRAWAGRPGTPGALLCGVDHHTLPIGFSVGGGSHSPALGDEDPATSPCPTCVAVAARMSLGAGPLAIDGLVGRDRARRAVVAELERMGAREWVEALDAVA